MLFIVSEGITTVYLRFLADFDNVSNGSSSIFNGDFRLYWTTLGGLVVGYFIILVAKYFTLNMAILLSSTSIHEVMIKAIVRSPGSFFDYTPSGVLVNKFSNDLGIIDKYLNSCFVDALEGPAVILAAVINICQINIFFLIPASVLFVIAILFMVYAR